MNSKWEIYLQLYPYMALGQLKKVEFSDFLKGFEKEEQKENNLTDEQMLEEIKLLEEIEKR